MDGNIDDRATQSIEGALEGSGRLDKMLALATDLSRERIKALIAQGAVQVDGETATSPSAKIAPKDASAPSPKSHGKHSGGGARFLIHLPPNAEPKALPQDIPLSVTFEDDHLIVVDKPAGMVVHPAAGNQDGTLVNALLHHCKGSLSGIGGVARPGIVHRIDKDTSGLLVAAKSDTAHERLARAFADHSIHRRYLALCAGVPRASSGTIAQRIGRSATNRKKMAVLPSDSTRGKHAVTHYKILKRGDHCALLECQLETGRTHQIRVHLASIAHPLIGDQTYGRTPRILREELRQMAFNRQALHAATLGFIHPITGVFAEYSAPLPADMANLIDQLT